MKKKTLTIGIVAIAIAIAVIVIELFVYGVIRPDKWFENKDYTPKLTSLGSAAELDGKTLVVSIFANDPTCGWDFQTSKDTDRRNDMLEYLGKATEYIHENSLLWGKNAEFIWDFNENADLYYEHTFDTELMCEDKTYDKIYNAEQEYINKKIDVTSLEEKYGASNAIFLFYLHDRAGYIGSCAGTFYFEDFPYPYEMCFFVDEDNINAPCPATFAHEILHLFGAPDLYQHCLPGYNYEISWDFVEYCRDNYGDDIMFTTFVPFAEKAERDIENISQRISEITAYYIGWTDEKPAVVDEYGLVPSQHVTIKQNH